MGSNKAPILIVLAGVIAAAALFVVLSGDDDADNGGEPAVATTTTTTADEPEPAEPEDEEQQPRQQADPKPKKPPVPSVEIRNGEPVGGVLEAEFDSGKRIELVITADTEDELHLHGYDEYIDVGPDRRTRVSVDATIEGIFELESHSTGALIARISVVP